jgi:hypothetical protein
MNQEQIPTVLPGDVFAYVVRFNYPGNVREVTATFRNETTGAEIVLSGEARLVRPGRRGTRRHIASLYYDEGYLDESPDDVVAETPDLGRYRLARLEATTYEGKTLDFDNPPEDAFRVADEPDESILPRLDRVEDPFSDEVPQATWFEFGEGHPDRRSPPRE